MSVLAAFQSGMRRVREAPHVLAAVFVLTFLAALPLALQVQEAISNSVGETVAAENAARGVDFTWWQRFTDEATGVARTFSPSVIGGAAVLDNASSFLDDSGHDMAIVVAGTAYLLLWLFLAGGIFDRYARDRKVGMSAFFNACGGYFGRLVRLALVAGLTYYALFAWLHDWLFNHVFVTATADWTVEWETFALRVGLYVLFGAVLCLCNLVFDYAKVRVVVEDRRSALGALVAAVQLVRRRPGVLGLYFLDGCCFAIVLAVYVLAAPGARVPFWLTLLAGQAYLLARIWVKLLFYASEVAYFQGALAHAAYVAAAVSTWPDSAAAAVADT